MNFSKKTKCPYCFKVIDYEFTRSGKCPHCGQKIILKQGEMITLEELSILESLSKYQIDKGLFLKERKQLSRKFGSKASINDTIWSILNKGTSNGNNFEIGISYFNMARLAAEEGKDTKPYTREENKFRLLEIKSYGFVSKVIIRNANDDNMCEACKKLGGKIMTIEYALENMPIPNLCTNDICRCWYEAYLES